MAGKLCEFASRILDFDFSAKTRAFDFSAKNRKKENFCFMFRLGSRQTVKSKMDSKTFVAANCIKY
jgi:hypothetical protein